MDLEKILKEFGKNIGKWICEEKESDVIININNFDEIDIFKIIFFKLVHENKFNEAENLLFKEVEKNNSIELYKIGFKFYNLLRTVDIKLLKANDFTEEDILCGVNDLQKYYRLKKI